MGARPGRFPSASDKIRLRRAAAGLLSSLRSKLPCAPIVALLYAPRKPGPPQSRRPGSHEAALWLHGRGGTTEQTSFRQRRKQVRAVCADDVGRGGAAERTSFRQRRKRVMWSLPRRHQAPSRPILAAGGSLLGLIVQGLLPSLSSDFSSDGFALGVRLKRLSLCFFKQW